MEQWEKEYLEIIQGNKRRERFTRGRDRVDGQYNDVYWEEVERPDGSKCYVPKQKAFDEQRNKDAVRAKRKRIFDTLMRGGGIVARIVAVVGIVAVGLLFYKNLEYDRGVAGSASIDVPANIPTNAPVNKTYIGGSYVDGIGFRNMMAFLEDCRIYSHDLLASVIESDFSLPEGEIKKRLEEVNELLDDCYSLKYHSTYEELVDAHRAVLGMDRELLEVLCCDDGMDMKIAAYNAASNKHNSLHDLIIAALKRNNIKYQEQNKSTIFWYNSY